MAEKKTVLVVDDDERVRKATRQTLEWGGFEVVEAEGGRQALEVVRANGTTYVGVVLDVMMPEMTGPEAFEELRRDHPEMPVMFVSGSDMKELRGVLDRTRVGFVAKPYQREELVNMARELFRGQV